MNWYIKVLKNYFNFKGRAQRAEYWYFILINAIITITLKVIDISLGYKEDGGILSGIYGLFILFPSITVGVRRLHDIGKSGWWLIAPWVLIFTYAILISLIFKDFNRYIALYLGIGTFVIFFYFYIILMIRDSVGENKYGQNPKLEVKTSNYDNDVNHIKSEIKILVAQGYTNEAISEKLATNNVSKEEVIKIIDSTYDVLPKANLEDKG